RDRILGARCAEDASFAPAGALSRRGAGRRQGSRRARLSMRSKPAPNTVDRDRLMGITMMAAAMLIVPMVDGIAKYLSHSYSPLFLGWVRYAVASLVVLPIAVRLYGKNLFPAERLGSHVARTIFLVGAMTLYFLAIARVQLVAAVSAYFVGPIFAVALAP